jgi:small subunit ribosomal protein S1
MMQTFRTEGNYRSADRLSPAELRTAIASREILQSTALAFDTQRQLRFDLGGVKAVMPFGQCADGAESGTVRDIAVLTRVGRPTCFVIEGMETGENGQPCYQLSRAEAQRMCKAEYLDTLQPGDILLHGHTHIPAWEVFGTDNLYLNPGSVSIPKAGTPHSYMTLENGVFTWKELGGDVYHTESL